jgi:hypothetical protein
MGFSDFLRSASIIAADASPIGAFNAVANKASGGNVGFDPTPNFSAQNVLSTQARKGVDAFTGANTNFAQAPAAPTGSQPVGNEASNGDYDSSGNYTGAATAAARQAAQDNAEYEVQDTNLRDLLGRLDPSLNQGLEQLNTTAQSAVNRQNSLKDQALQDYQEQRVSTQKDKQSAYGTINKNANNGYRSLAQIIGRSAGTGSSAFQELLPDVVGRETSSKRGEANTTYASNLGNINNAQKKTELSFEQILQDLAEQRKAQEQQLRTGVENQRQSLVGQQQALEGQRGNIAGVRALQPQIESSRNTVEGFFNQFKPQLVERQAAIAAPDLNQYNTDRANVNAQAQGSQDPTNPYADILRKKLQEQAL